MKIHLQFSIIWQGFQNYSIGIMLTDKCIIVIFESLIDVALIWTLVFSHSNDLRKSFRLLAGPTKTQQKSKTNVIMTTKL